MQYELDISSPSEDDTIAIAHDLAGFLKAPGVIYLNGPVGAGKSAFSRAFIRAKMGREIDVPSPTFTLIQTYDGPDEEIWHIDLYRLSDSSELVEFGLEDTDALCLIEWPDLARTVLDDPVLEITIDVIEEMRVLHFSTPSKALFDHLRLTRQSSGG